MKRVVFDHSVPKRLRRLLSTFDIKLARELGWAELRNGKLLDIAESSGFHVLLTADRTMHHEQRIAGRRIGLVSMSDNHWNIVRHYVPKIAEAIDDVKPGEVLPVFCGKFVPSRFRRI